MKNHIQYRNVLIAKNSHAYELWEANAFKALDKHIALTPSLAVLGPVLQHPAERPERACERRRFPCEGRAKV